MDLSRPILLTLFLLVNCCPFFVFTFNFDADNPIFFKPNRLNQDPSNPNQAFGSSVALIKFNETTRIIIGAPKGNSGLIKVPQTGLIYSCEIKSNGKTTTCDEIKLNFSSHRKSFKMKHLFSSGMHLGLNLAVDQFNNLITVCGHLHNLNNQPSGICFLVSATDWRVIKILFPKTRKSLVPSYKKSMFKATSEMFGFSTTFTSRDNINGSNKIIFGAPGYDNFRGALFASSNFNNVSTFPVKVTINTIKESDQDSYIGYSLTTGLFFTSQPELVAVGAPRAQQLKGQVAIIDLNQGDLYGDIIQSLEGQQLGEYFGYSIASIDLDNNGYHDLLIGAPLYMPEHNPKGDCGRVYIHYSNGIHFNHQTIIDGDSIHGSRFGSSIAFIGDLDGDGFNDFVVGAPLENRGSGSVYVYSGSPFQTNAKKYLQKIVASKSFDSIFGFGSSLYSGPDIDNDNCPDLLVGCYLSDTVVLLKCRL